MHRSGYWRRVSSRSCATLIALVRRLSRQLQIVRALSVVLFREIFGGFRADFFIIIIPRAGPFSAPLPIIVARVDRNAMARPRPETGFDPVEWPLRAIGRHRFAQDRRARLALLGGQLVEPLAVLIGQVDRKSTRLHSR